jgi:SAM-dependent methyltransferase
VPDERTARRREHFDGVAEDYDRYRRPAPPEVVEDLVVPAGIGAGSRVLEIACGTGQLSLPLARLGVELTAVELGAALAAIARRHLEPFPHAAVHIAAFEEWPLPEEPFDAVVCSNAFHWLDPAVRLAKCAEALRPGGTLAILAVHHVAGGTRPFFSESQSCFVEAGLAKDFNFKLPEVDEAPTAFPELEDDPRFTGVERHPHAAELRLTTAEHVGWLRTDSLVGTIPAPARQRFLECIGELIDSRFDGVIHRAYVYEVVLARRP